MPLSFFRTVMNYAAQLAALAAAVRQIINKDGHEGKAYSVTSGEAA